MHPSPDVLALLALGEQAGTSADREHVAGCAECRAEVESLARAVDVGRSADAGDDTLLTPPDRVWEAIRAELNFGQEGFRNGAATATQLTQGAAKIDSNLAKRDREMWNAEHRNENGFVTEPYPGYPAYEVNAPRR